MKAKFVLSSLGVALFTLCGCGDYDSSNPAAYLSNNSPHDIVVYWAKGSQYPSGYEYKVYPDTTLPDTYFYFDFEIKNYNDSASWYNPMSNIISVGDCANVGDWDPNPIDYLFENISRLSVFVFHADTIRKYSWEEIRDSYNILVRYDLSERDVRSFKNHTIPFPPTGAMRDMKMWPPYEEVMKRYE